MSARRPFKFVILGATLGLAASAALGTAAAAAEDPSPRGPVGGCGQGFELVSLQELQERFGRAPTSFDVNLDGLVCFRRAPAPQAEAFIGISVDNTAVGQR